MALPLTANNSTPVSGIEAAYGSDWQKKRNKSYLPVLLGRVSFFNTRLSKTESLNNKSFLCVNVFLFLV